MGRSRPARPVGKPWRTRCQPEAQGRSPLKQHIAGRTIADGTLLEIARALYRERRVRARFFAGTLFAEPTWDMLLDLYIANGDRRRVTVKSVCISADVPMTTALRHLRWLQEQGLVERLVHPRDARSMHVRLSTDAVIAMERYLREL